MSVANITLIVVMASLLLLAYQLVSRKPRLRVTFPDGSTRATYRVGEEATVSLHIKNTGRLLGLIKVAATYMTVATYLPHNFALKELGRYPFFAHEVHDAAMEGVFRGMKYLQFGGEVQVLWLHPGEVEVFQLQATMPGSSGSYPMKVAIFAREGYLGVHQLQVSVV